MKEAFDRAAQDIRFGARMLAKRPAVTAVAVLSLALGIGANTAIFSVVDAVLFEPLPYAEPERLVRIWETFMHPQGRGYGSVSVPNLVDWQAQSTVFEALGAYSMDNVALGVALGFADGPERVRAAYLTPEVMSILGASAALGRTLGPADPAPAPVAVISHQLWRDRFAADPAAVGTTVRFDGEPFEIAGVMPPEFDFPPRSNTKLWAPLRLSESARATRGSHWLSTVARLRPGVELAAAEAEMQAIAARLAEAYPEDQAERGAEILPLSEWTVRHQRAILLGLWGAVGLVLLIACANVANLLLARATARRRELAIRTALGAGRLRLVRQGLTESLLLALGGGVAGWGLGLLTLQGLTRLPGSKLPAAEALRLDPAVLAYALAISLAAALLAGLVPALRTSGVRPQEALHARSGRLAGRRDPVREGLVVVEVALALVVLIGAGLMVRTLLHLLETDTGIESESVLTARVALPEVRYGEDGAANRFWQRLLEDTEAIPGVERAGAISHLPFDSWGFNGDFWIAGRPQPPPGQQPFTEFRAVGGDYFRALGIPLLAGRGITGSDGAEAPAVAVINRTLAEQQWPGEDPLGQRVALDPAPGEDGWITVVGVVRDVRSSGLDQETRPEMYFPLAQRERRQMTLVARTVVPPASAIPALRAALAGIDPDQPLFRVLTMEQVVGDHLAGRRFDTSLIAVFALLALALAMAGVFGVMSYAVGQRKREIGLRMALGARTGDVLRLILRHGLLLAGAGAALGIALAWAATRWLRSQLVGVAVTDVTAYAAAALLLLGVAFAACWFPAQRAARVQPTVALRDE